MMGCLPRTFPPAGIIGIVSGSLYEWGFALIKVLVTGRGGKGIAICERRG